jgi:hypothetical protein
LTAIIRQQHYFQLTQPVDTQPNQLEARSGPFAKSREWQLIGREWHHTPLTHRPLCSSMPPASEFLAGWQMSAAQFKSRPEQGMNYLFRFNQLLAIDRSTLGHY